MLIKVASLSEEEMKSFVRLDQGRYVLAKQLQSYDWDKGSIWKLVSTKEGLAIAREDEEKEQGEEGHPTGIFDTKCARCGTKLIDAEVHGKQIRTCSVCHPELVSSLQKSAALQSPEITEDNPSGVPGNFTVQANGYLTGRLLPIVYGWLDKGYSDLSKEAFLAKVDEVAGAGRLNDTDAGMLRANAEMLLRYAHDYLNPPELIEEEFEQARYKPAVPEAKEASMPTEADAKISFLIRNKPAGMPVQTFTSLFNTLKTEAHATK